MRQVIIYPGEDGYWVAECPSLPGCVSQGETKEKAIQNILPYDVPEIVAVPIVSGSQPYLRWVDKALIINQ